MPERYWSIAGTGWPKGQLYGRRGWPKGQLYARSAG
jgi:hypothetical protein